MNALLMTVTTLTMLVASSRFAADPAIAPPTWSSLRVDTSAQERENKVGSGSGNSGLSSEEQIARNQKTYNTEKVRLVREHAGQWLAIVNGQLSGPWQSIEDAANKCPDAEHRLIFRPGMDDGDVEFPLSPFIARSEKNWIQFGYQLASDHKFRMSYDTWESGPNQLKLRKDGRAGFAMLSPDGSATINRHAVCSSLFRDQIAITENEVRELGLSKFRVPGVATYDKDHPGYKVFVKVQIPELAIDEYMLAYVLPDSLVKKGIYIQDDLDDELKSLLNFGNENEDAMDDQQPAVKPFRWTMIGQVTDEQGNPLPDVEVKLATGIATLTPGG